MRFDVIDGSAELGDDALVLAVDADWRGNPVGKTWVRTFPYSGITGVAVTQTGRRKPALFELVAVQDRADAPLEHVRFRVATVTEAESLEAALLQRVGELLPFKQAARAMKSEKSTREADDDRAYRALRKRERHEVAQTPERAVFAGYSIRGDRIHHGTSSWPTAGATADVDGTTASRVGVTRTVGGAAVGTLIAPGLGTAAGALLGASAKKDASKRYVTVTTTTGSFVIPFHPSQETAARRFAAAINTAA